MKKFIVNIFIFLLFFILIFEFLQGTTSPIFSLRQFTADIKRAFSNPITLVENDSIGYDPNGNKISLNINNVGYYAHRNFYSDSIVGNYALVGDSFVKSEICGTYNSIAYLLDQMIEPKVYNFGEGGGNVNTYNDIYNEFGLNQAKTVFILITGTNDLIHKKRKKITKRSKLKIINLINQRFNGPQIYSQPNFNLFNSDFQNVVYLLHDNLTKESMLKHNIDKPIIELDISGKYRFSDGHYTREGNLIIANAIKDYLESEESHDLKN